MRRPVAPEVTGPLDAVHAAVRSRDAAQLDAALTDDALLSVPALPGWSWGEPAGRQQAWRRLFADVPDATYAGERRYVSAGMHGEEGVLRGTLRGAATATGADEPFAVTVRVVAHLDGDRICRLEVSGDSSALPPSLRGSALGAGQALDGLLGLRQSAPPGELRILGDAGPGAGAGAGDGARDRLDDAAAGAHAAPHRRRSRWLLAAPAVLLLAAGVAAAVLLTDEQGRPAAAVATKASAPDQPPGSAPPAAAPSAAASPDELPAIDAGAPSAAPQVQVGEQLVLRSDVLFEVDSAELSPQATAALADLAADIAARGVTGTVQVNGYTDDTGTDAYDLALSQARALAVAQALQGYLAGVPVTLQPQGFGALDPVADNTTDQGRAQNRRVTIILPEPPA